MIDYDTMSYIVFRQEFSAIYRLTGPVVVSVLTSGYVHWLLISTVFAIDLV